MHDVVYLHASFNPFSHIFLRFLLSADGNSFYKMHIIPSCSRSVKYLSSTLRTPVEKGWTPSWVASIHVVVVGRKRGASTKFHSCCKSLCYFTGSHPSPRAPISSLERDGCIWKGRFNSPRALFWNTPRGDCHREVAPKKPWIIQSKSQISIDVTCKRH